MGMSLGRSGENPAIDDAFFPEEKKKKHPRTVHARKEQLRQELVWNGGRKTFRDRKMCAKLSPKRVEHASSGRRRATYKDRK